MAGSTGWGGLSVCRTMKMNKVVVPKRAENDVFHILHTDSCNNAASPRDYSNRRCSVVVSPAPLSLRDKDGLAVQYQPFHPNCEAHTKDRYCCMYIDGARSPEGRIPF